MKSYIINLDRSQDRWAFMSAQAIAAKLDIERIAAIDGKTLSPGEIADVNAHPFEFQPLNRGEIGVFMSHRATWRALLDSGRSHAAIFEDDVVLAPDLGNLLDTIEAVRPEADIIKLETTLRPLVLGAASTPLSGGYALRRLFTWHGGAAGYVISRECAFRLLHLTGAIADPIDQVMFNPLARVSRQLRILQLNPGACVQHFILDRDRGAMKFYSTVERNKTRGRLFRHGPLIDARRAGKRIYEAMRRHVLGRLRGYAPATIAFAQTGRTTTDKSPAPKAGGTND